MNKITIDVGAEMFRFHSIAQWVDKAKGWFEASGVRGGDYVCVDARGRLCRCGAQFSRAEREGTYPIVVYRCDSEEGA